jgi:hypothetical protein
VSNDLYGVTHLGDSAPISFFFEALPYTKEAKKSDFSDSLDKAICKRGLPNRP